MRTIALACAFALSTSAHAGTSHWQVHDVAGVTVHHASVPGSRLASLSNVLFMAVADLGARSELALCDGPELFIHPDLDSFVTATGLAWYHLAVADRAVCRIDMQRLPVVDRHGGVDRSLRHELFHLAQPAGWERWRAEGEAQRFAGELPDLQPLAGISPQQLDALLGSAPDQLTLGRAMATAFQWVLQGR